MAVVDRNSDVIANMVATPKVFNQPISKGVLKEVVGVVTPAADDTVASIHRFVRVPSNARISQVLISAADATTAPICACAADATADPELQLLMVIAVPALERRLPSSVQTVNWTRAPPTLTTVTCSCRNTG